MKVYLLKAVEILSRKNADNSILSWEYELGVFDSVKKAEDTIRGYAVLISPRRSKIAL